jgi:micrococcal nuclease
MPRDTALTLTTDPSQDRIDHYGRLLAYVFLPGRRRTVNEVLVRRGAAVVDVYRPSGPPRRIAQLRAAEGVARAARAGLWGACGHGSSDEMG